MDLGGYLLLPAPAEPHAHADTALSAVAAAASAASVASVTDGPVPPQYEAEVKRRATEAALVQLAHGATAMRSHVRIGDVQGLTALTAVLEVARSLRGLTHLTVVAMPRVLTGTAGADGLAMLRDAMKAGAAVVGGCPDADPDPAGYAEAILDLAGEYGCPVDLHTDAADPARLARLAAMAAGLRPRVTLGPCAGLGLLPADVAARAADQLAAAGVTVVCLPQGGCAGTEGCRRGAYGHDPGLARSAAAAAGSTPLGAAPVLPVRLLRSAGVQVVAGSGALRDRANPVGRGDPLEAAYLLSSHHGLSPEDAYEAVSGDARRALGLPEVRVEAGFPAELLAVRGDDLAGALSLAYSRIVVHQGRVVARTSAVREYCGLGGRAPAPGPELPRQGRAEQ